MVLLVEPLTPPVEPELELEPGPPIELVPPLPLEPLVEVSLLPPDVPPLAPAVLPDPEVLPDPAVLPMLPDPEPAVPLVEGLEGLVLEELLEPVAPVEPVVPSRLSQALSERAATTAMVAAAH